LSARLWFELIISSFSIFYFSLRDDTDDNYSVLSARTSENGIHGDDIRNGDKEFHEQVSDTGKYRRNDVNVFTDLTVE